MNWNNDPANFAKYWKKQIVGRSGKTLLKNICELLAPGTHYSLLPQLDEKYFCQILLCVSDDYDVAINSQIFSHVQRFIDSTARF